MPDKKKLGDEEEIDPDLLDAAIAGDEVEEEEDEDVIPGLLGDDEEETL